MRIIPDSTINLYSNIPIDNGEQLAFSSQQKQTDYFLSHLVRSETPCTVVKKTGELKVSASMLIVSTCNYISFVNPSFDNRTVYARIIDYDYVNNETTSIVYAIDMWQTWMFDVTFENMYIEREHLSNEGWALAEANPYDIRIAEFRTGEVLPINGETEKYFYEISDDYSDRTTILTPDGYKIGKVVENDIGATDQLGVLVKLSNIDFNDLDYASEATYEDWNRVNWDSSDTGLVDYGDGRVTDGNMSDSDLSGGNMIRYKFSVANSLSFNVIIDGSGIHAEQGYSLPYNKNGVYIDVIHSGTTYSAVMEVTSSSSWGITWNTYTSNYERASDWFISFLREIEQQTFGYWAVPFGTYEYLHERDNTFNQNSGVGSGWTAQSTSPFTSNNFRNQCIYIYDANGGTTSEIITKLLSKLTLWNCVSSIVDMVVIPNNIMFMSGVSVASGSSQAVWQLEQKTVKTELSVVNKKLMLYPFSYLRLLMPNGDVKELHFEDFKNVREGGDMCLICVALDIADKPILMIAPYQYKISGLSNVAVNDCNIKEAVFFKQFPTAPYTIDSYLAQVASYAGEVMRSNTLENLYNYASSVNAVDKTNEVLHDIGIVGAIFGAVTHGVGRSSVVETNIPASGGYSYSETTSSQGMSGAGVGAGLALAANQRNYQMRLETQRQQLSRIANERADVDSVMRGNIAGAIGSSIALTRGAYASDKYIPSNGAGVTNFNVMSIDDVVYQRVTLNNVMLERYDNYFTHYGYTSGRCGIPRVINFIHGLTANTPHWLTLNGKEITYVKTTDCKVIHSMVGVADAIKAMFDSGVRFIKGDLS